MQNVSNAFKIAALQQAREVRAKATLTLEDQTVFHLTAADFVSGSLSMTQQIMTKSFEVGTAYVSECTLSLTNYDNAWDEVSLEGALFQPYSGLVLNDNSVEYVLLGTFIIDEVTYAGPVVALKASDRLILLDRPFADVSLSGVTSVKDALEAICLRCMVPIKTGFNGAGLNVPFTENLAELSGLTCRSIVAQIALLVGAVVRMTRTGELDFVRVAGASAPHVLPYGSRMSFNHKGEPGTLTGLLYGGGAEPTLYGTDTGDVLAVSEMIILPAEERENALAAIWANVEGYTLTGYTANYWGNPAIDAGDVIKHELKDDKEATGILMRHTFRHGGASTLESFTVAKTDKKYQAANSRRWASMLDGLREQTDERLTNYEQAAANMADMLGLMMGVYPSQEVLEDSSTIYYWHNKPTLEESDIIWKFNGLALAVSNDGGQTWTGQTSDGTVIAKVVHALDITADMIKLTDTQSVSDRLSSNASSISTIEAGMASFTTTVGGTTYIDGGMIRTGTVGANQIIAGSIDTAELAAGAVTNSKLDSGSVTADKILSGAVTAVKLADGAVTANKIAARAITVSELADIAGFRFYENYMQSRGSYYVRIAGGATLNPIQCGPTVDNTVFKVDGGGTCTCTSVVVTGKVTSNTSSSIAGALNSTSGRHNGTVYSGSGSLGGVGYVSSGGYLRFNGTVHVQNNFRVMDNLTVDGDITYYGNMIPKSSDARLKENIKALDIDLARDIYNLDMVEFDFIDKPRPRKKIGVTAQQLIKDAPTIAARVVAPDENGYLAVDYEDLKLLSFIAIQDLNRRIKKLEEAS